MAVTVAVSATAPNIIVSGSGSITLDGIYEYIATTLGLGAGNNYMSKTANGSYWIYTINPNTTLQYMELEIRTGVTVTFEAFDELRWIWGTTSTAYYIIDGQAGSTLVAEEGFTFDFGYSGSYCYAYLNFVCSFNMVGTESNNVILKNYRINYFNPNYYDINLQYVTFKNITATGTSAYFWYQLYFYSTFYYPSRTMILKNLTFTNDAGYTNRGRIYISNGTIFDDKYVFENCLFEKFYSVDLNSTPPIHFKNCTFRDSLSVVQCFGGGGNTNPPYIIELTDRQLPNPSLQPHLFFEDCSFDDVDSGVYGIYFHYNALSYFKNCDFNNQTSGLISGNGAITRVNNITYNSCTAERNDWTNSGTFVHCRELDITVQDVNLDPIENVAVTIIQSEGKEKWSDFTNSSGKLLSAWGHNIALVEKLETTTEGTYTNWSDSIASGRYHSIIVSKEGYDTQEIQLEMTEDKTVVVTLLESGETTHDTKIYGSTLYGSTIY